MRLSLVISLPPAARGTLKSTRMKRRLPLRSRSRMESLGIGLVCTREIRREARGAIGFEQRALRRAVKRGNTAIPFLEFQQRAKSFTQHTAVKNTADSSDAGRFAGFPQAAAHGSAERGEILRGTVEDVAGYRVTLHGGFVDAHGERRHTRARPIEGIENVQGVVGIASAGRFE